MSSIATLFKSGQDHHLELISLLDDLDIAEQQGGQLPVEADGLRKVIWPFLQAYGLRDEHGSVISELPAAAAEVNA